MNPEDTENPVVLQGGKYTIQKDGKGMLEFLRYGEAWPAADDMKYSQMVIAMYNEIQDLSRENANIQCKLAKLNQELNEVYAQIQAARA